MHTCSKTNQGWQLLYIAKKPKQSQELIYSPARLNAKNWRAISAAVLMVELVLVGLMPLAAPSSSIAEVTTEKRKDTLPSSMYKQFEEAKTAEDKAARSELYRKIFNEVKTKKPSKYRPSDLAAYYDLQSRVFVADDQLKDARRTALHSLHFRAKNSDLLHIVGISLLKDGNPELAGQYLEEAIWFDAYAEYKPGESWLALAEVYKQTEQDEKLVVALENGVKQKGGSDGANGAFLLARNKLESGDIAAAKKVLTGLETQTPQEALEQQVLLGQVALLSRSNVSSAKEFGDSAEKIQQALQETADTDISKDLKALSEEISIRLWLASGETAKAVSTLEKAKADLKDSPSLAELSRQIKLLQ